MGEYSHVGYLALRMRSMAFYVYGIFVGCLPTQAVSIDLCILRECTLYKRIVRLHECHVKQS